MNEHQLAYMKKMAERCRMRFCFDGNEPDEPLRELMGAKWCDGFVASESGNTFWLRGGSNGGVRALIHVLDTENPLSPEDRDFGDRRECWSPDRRNRRYFVSRRMFGEDMVECDPDMAVSALKKYAHAFRGRTLETMDKIPGFSLGEDRNYWFNKEEYYGRWFSKSAFAVKVDPPSWAPEAQAWNIQEGILLIFLDGTIRLIADRREFFNFPYRDNGVIARQGDLLVFNERMSLPQSRPQDHATARFHDLPLSVNVSPEGLQIIDIHAYANNKEKGLVETFSLDRHQILKEGDQWVVKHPEHETLALPQGKHCLNLVLVPGTSRPFKKGDDLD